MMIAIAESRRKFKALVADWIPDSGMETRFNNSASPVDAGTSFS
jgi:hypothetical protein